VQVRTGSYSCSKNIVMSSDSWVGVEGDVEGACFGSRYSRPLGILDTVRLVVMFQTGRIGTVMKSMRCI